MAYPTVSTLKTPCPSYEGSIGGVLNIAVYSALKSDYPVLSINKTHVVVLKLNWDPRPKDLRA